MDQIVVLFLLFFAALAFAYFYLQRAKARPTNTTTVDHAETDSAPRPVDRPE